MKKILILIVVLAGIAGAYFFLSKPASSSGSASGEESQERGAEVAKSTDSKTSKPSSPIIATGDTEEMDESTSSPETTPLTKVQPAIEVTVRDDVAEAVEESADDIVEVAEAVAEEIVEEVAEAIVVTEQEIVAEAEANAAATVEETTTVVEETQESLEVETDAAVEALASEIAANNAALVEEVEVVADPDPREEIFTKLESMVASGAITRDQFALLTAAMAASADDSEISAPEWLLDPPAVDWTAVSARIQSLKDAGSITDEQFEKFQSNIAKYQPIVETPEETLSQNFDAAANQSASEDMTSNVPASAMDSPHAESASKYDVRINGYPLPAHLSSNMKFSIVELFLNKDGGDVSSQRITINNHLMPQNLDPIVLGKLFDLLLSREASE